MNTIATTSATASMTMLDLRQVKTKLMHVASGEGWSASHADAVEIEYRRFLTLMKLYPNEVTAPLVDVDTFWHYHILDTAKYAADCELAFGYFLHHYPYLGMDGAADAATRDGAGARMQELYAATFGTDLTGPAAWCGATVQKSATAWCGAAVQQPTTAWCGAAVQQPTTAWCGAAVQQAATAWCGAAAQQPATAWCGAAVQQPATAWCGAAVQKAATAWCGAAVQRPATAWCGAAVQAATAWCGAAQPARLQGSNDGVDTILLAA